MAAPAGGAGAVGGASLGAAAPTTAATTAAAAPTTAATTAATTGAGSAIPVVESVGIPGAGHAIQAPTTFLGKVGEAIRVGGGRVFQFVGNRPLTSLGIGLVGSQVMQGAQARKDRRRRGENLESYGDIDWSGIFNNNPPTDLEMDSAGIAGAGPDPTRNPMAASAGQSGLDIGAANPFGSQGMVQPQGGYGAASPGLGAALPPIGGLGMRRDEEAVA